MGRGLRTTTRNLGIIFEESISPSLDILHIRFANITERYSRNTNICQLYNLIFHKIYQGRNNNNNMSSSSTCCVANKRQIDKGFAKSRRQIYELIGLLPYYLQDSFSLILVLLCNYKFLAHPIKSLTDRANLNKRLGLRFTKIFKRLAIGEHKCRLCLADVRGGEMNA